MEPSELLLPLKNPGTRYNRADIGKARPLSSGSRSKYSHIQNGRHSARSLCRGTEAVPSLPTQNPLKIQSSPIHLATRSLSARSSTSSLPTLTVSLPASAKSRGPTIPPRDSTKSTSKRSCGIRKKTSETTSNPLSNGDHYTQSLAPQTSTDNQTLRNKLVHSPQLNSVSQSAERGKKGFNIAGHLRNSVELDRSSGSLSPDVDQFLKDIGAVMRSITPDSANVAIESVKGQTSNPASETNVANVCDDYNSPPSSSYNTRNHTNGAPTDSSRKSKKTRKINVAAKFVTVPDQNRKTLEHDSQGPRDRVATVPKLDLHNHPDSIHTKHDHMSDPHSKPSTPQQHEPTSSHGRVQTSIDPNTAAAKIQTWYRRLRSTRYASVQSVLHEKRDELNRSRVEELRISKLEVESKELEEMKKKQRRAVKMQAARKAVIDDLHKRREEKRLRTEKIAQEEIAFLKASGKIKKHRPSQKKTRMVPNSTMSESQHQNLRDSDVINDKPSGVQEQLVDEFFQAGNTRQRELSASRDTSASPEEPTTKPKHGNTYNDILETLKLLEDVPAPFSTGKGEVHVPTVGDPYGAYLSAKNLKSLGTPSAAPGHHSNAPPLSGSLSEGKLHSILAYLDEMEQADQDLLSQLSKSRSEAKTRGLSTAADSRTSPRASHGARSVIKNGKSVRGTDKTTVEGSEQNNTDATLEAATAVASDVTTTILAQRIELDNKNKTVEMLQKALNQQRELTVYHAKEMDKDGQKKIDLLRTEYESRIQRHQSFIDQLIDDKKVLSERCEQLVKDLRELDKKYKTKLKTLEEKHTTEVSKLKQVSAAADKLRREKWKADETQRIKEATVKSLEPEIQRIIAKGKAEVQRVKALHEAEMMQVDERASRRFVAQMEEIRAQCAEEKEHACAHERELARQRYEKLAEQEEINYQQLRRKLFAEVQQEKNRLADQFQHQKVSTDQRIEDMQNTHQRLIEDLKSEHTRQIGEMERRHNCDIKDLQERSKVEKQTWEENLLRRQEANALSKEREIRDQLRKERDKEIELVITRLEEETTSSKEEVERAAEARIRRVREKYEAELREVERSERNTQEKFSNLKTQVVEHEGELSRLRSLLRQKQDEVEHVGEVASKLTRERDSVADIVRQEFADRLVRTNEENKELKIEMSELRARHKVELERVGRDKDREMESVHERVKQAIGKKEDNLRSLREQYEAALKRADHLEMLLEQQRKQLLKK